jgi:hypothetical protein
VAVEEIFALSVEDNSICSIDLAPTGVLTP